MIVDFPYPGYEAIAPAEVPDANLLGVYAPRTIDTPDAEEIVRRGIADPIGAPRLREAVRPSDRVLLLVDDATRTTPVVLVLPHVIAELEAAGLADDQIIILTAQGTHRRMTELELRAKLGAMRARFVVHQHDWRNEATLHDFGQTSDGTRVTANRLLAQAEFILGIGSIAPHRIKGFSGGAKIAFPGVAGREIQERNQWHAAQLRSEDVMGIAENAMRHRIEEAARLVGLRYIVNTVGDGAGRVAGCFAGDVVLAHRAGCRLAQEINEVVLPARAGIVLTDAHPADRDLWQSAKGVYSGTMAVRDGGTLIMVAPNPEGVAEHHPVMVEVGYHPFRELAQMVDEGCVEDLVGISVLADLAQVMDRVECILVSPGVSRDSAVRLGFRPARSVQDALDCARERHRRDESIAVLRRGGHVLPRVAGERYDA
jgi:nickel-dependent lactate racemase